MGLRELLDNEEIVIAPAAYDVVSALIIEKAGFPLAYLSGLGNEASDLGYPDLGLATVSELVRKAGNIAAVVKVPVVCDADTGFGGDINLRRTVRMFEAAGVSGIHIEDQTFPKRCGAIRGKQVIEAEQFAQKIRTAVDARKNADFVIIARTDSKVAGGIDEAIRRLNMYIENGADMAMVGDLYTFDQYLRLVREVKAPLAACAADPERFYIQPDFTLEQWKKTGVKMVLYWYLPLFAAMKAVQNAVTSLKRTGSTNEITGQLLTYKEYAETVDLDEWLGKV
ncbi:MAG TPA: isocitrate lyase/PEP mutase family protein [Syntrophobacteraceae bacterium]|nr:isocitrate lyase/PEP mutase family protein [Syntrophobacteraceae bacterium]